MRRQTDGFVITRRDQVQVVASPARQEILDTVSAVGPSSIREIAELLGRTRHSLYYHVKALRDVGLLIEETRVRPNGRGEAVYETPSPRMYLDVSRRNRDLHHETLDAVLRVARRDLRKSFEQRDALDTEPRRVWVGRGKGWVTPKTLAEINTHIEAIIDILGRGTRPKDGELHAVTWAHMPVSPANP